MIRTKSLMIGAVMAIAVSACGSDAGTPMQDTSTTTAAPATSASPPTSAAPDSPDAEAVERALAFWAALHEDRVVDLPAIFGAELSEADRLLWEFNAILLQAYPRQIHGCEVTQSVGSLVMVDCMVTFSDPVYISTGTADMTHPFRYQDGVVLWQEMHLTEGAGSPFTASAAYAEYLQAFRAEDFALACSREAYEGDIVFNGHLALTPACAELLVASSENVAAWVDAGRPAEWEG